MTEKKTTAKKAARKTVTRKTATKKTATGKAATKKTTARKKAAPRKKVAETTAEKKNRYQQIEEAAYLMAEKDGFRQDPVNYWLAAEMEVQA